MDKKEKEQLLSKLKEKMLKDGSLPLKKGANNLVFGEGSVDAKIMFIGEGPGYWEDQKARPFVGNAGAFLNFALHSIKVPRESVFITNVVHHRPPNNRDPLPEELTAYAKYLDEIIKIINPETIVTLGRFSMGKFLPGAMISRIHGKVQEISWKGTDITVVPMYHPAAALRNGEVKRQFMEDFKKILEIKEKSPVKEEVEQMELV